VRCTRSTLCRGSDAFELRVAFRRSQRIGPQIGNDVEDFGIRPDYVYDMTRNDLLKGNVDLINYAIGLLV
jgi:hypothetical protein